MQENITQQLITTSDYTLVFHGIELKYPSALPQYIKTKNIFLPVATETYNKMTSNFDEKVGTFEKFVDNGRSFFISSIKPMLSFVIQELAVYNCFNFDEESFFEEIVCVRFDHIADIHEKISLQLQEIRENQSAINARRTEERHRAVAEGKSEIEMMLWNGLKRMGDDVVNSIKGDNIYNEQIKTTLKKEFHKICFGIIDDFTKALFVSKNIDIRNPISLENNRMAVNIFERLKRGGMAENEKIELTAKALQLNPALNGLLEWCVEQYLDQDGTLQQLSEMVYIDISKAKEKILNRNFCIDSEENAIKTQAYLVEMKDRLTYSNPKLEEQVKNAIKEFDRKARTFANVEYPTRTEATNARKEKETIDEIGKKYSKAHTQQEYNAWIAELNAGHFIYGFEKKIIEAIIEKQNALLKTETKLIESYSISQEKVKFVMQQINLLKDFGNKAVKGFEPDSNTATELRGVCEISNDDFVIGVIDTSLSENNRKGLIITNNGIYISKYRSWSIWESCIFIAVAVFLWPKFVFWKWIFLLFVVLAALIVLRRILIATRKIITQNKSNYNFVPWNQAEIRCKETSSVIAITEKRLFKIPFHSDLSKYQVKLVKLLEQLAQLAKNE